MATGRCENISQEPVRCLVALQQNEGGKEGILLLMSLLLSVVLS